MSDPSQHTCGLNGLRIEGVPCPVCAPLSPIALDFEAAHTELWRPVVEQYGAVPDGTQMDVSPGMQRVLNAQLRAIVARVAQEEREKVLKEVLAVMRTHNPKGNTAQHVVDQTYEWLHAHLRGTP